MAFSQRTRWQIPTWGAGRPRLEANAPIHHFWRMRGTIPWEDEIAIPQVGNQAWGRAPRGLVLSGEYT